MLSFKTVGLADMETLRACFAAAPSRSSDFTAGAVVMWRNYFETQYALHAGSLLLQYRLLEGGHRTAFNMPLGGDVAGALRALEAHCAQEGLPMLLCSVTEEELAVLRSLYPLRELTGNPDWSDYLYLAEDLRTLTGRRYNGQRNHINYFRRAYPDYRFEETHPADMEELLSFYKHSGRVDIKDSDYFQMEQETVFEVLGHYAEYGFFGGIIRAQDSIVAFSMGEIVGDTLFVHIEKANPAYRGAYQMMVHEFVKRYASPGALYVNREEDCGDDGLRRSKQSYHPCQMIDKYLVEIG